MTSVIVLLVVGSGLWVYLDATSNRIGKIPNGSGMFNMSAGAWAAATIGLWVIAFPAYLIKRGDLIAAAKETPIEVVGRGGKAAALVLIGGGAMAVLAAGSTPQGLPACNSQEATALVGQIVEGSALAKLAGAQYVSMKSISEQGYNQQSEVRACAGTIVTTAGEDAVQYSIKWQNKDAGRFEIEARTL